ncbi:MAG TPA: hypothetical protein VFR97_11100 [Capillimicrobium sp.]|nr:hypothetical protein [Capillimicrobium sp.]
MRRVLAMTACCALLAGCGGGTRQDADEASGTYELKVVSATFPQSQSISEPAKLRIAVRNTGEGTAPDVAVSLDGLYRRNEMPGLADPEQPVFIVDEEPQDGHTAYVGTWALGPLPAGGTREFTWKLTPAVAGTHTVKYTVAAGLDGKAKARTAGGGPPSGSITVRVSDAPADATVNPETGAVER